MKIETEYFDRAVETKFCENSNKKTTKTRTVSVIIMIYEKTTLRKQRKHFREGKFSVDSVDMKMREYWSRGRRKAGLSARGKREYTCTLEFRRKYCFELFIQSSWASLLVTYIVIFDIFRYLSKKIGKKIKI